MSRLMKLILSIILLFSEPAIAQTNLISHTRIPGASGINSESRSSSLSCTNWLNLPSYQSYVSIGDLDVPGNVITVEATFVRTAPYSNGYNWAGDLVSKHVDPTDANYLLRPNNAEITTTNGYFSTPPICEIQLNKVYHAAMVYDGSRLKFYRNGFLMSSVPATGNLFQNNHQARIGLYDALTWNTNLIGFINEVRIWNVARTQAEIRTYMNSSLPNPTTQAGLLAYYQFDNLLNKQGNSNWNGTLGGAASLNATTPACNFNADSCNVNANLISGIINDYTPVLSLLPCTNKIIVEDGTPFNAGDTVLLIQMKGAVIDSSNTSSFGTISDLKNAGNYEFNYVKSRNGNTIELLNVLNRQYDIPDGKVQLIRVPYYTSVVVSNVLTCLPWDGKKGGVLVLNARDTITLQSSIDVSGKGFNGGQILNPRNNSFYCHENDFYYPNDLIKAAPKGEGIASLSVQRLNGKGALANGGGGGLEHNSGGAGGGNGGTGGKGGKEWISCGPPLDNGGLGGIALPYNNALNKIFLGGGGGAGHCDNPPGFNPSGANGGGIIIMQSNFLRTNSNNIYSNGAHAIECVRDGQAYKCHEGMGGGGSGGTVLAKINTWLDNTAIFIKGGKGADMNGEIQGKLGPGGGGGGGIVWFNTATIPSQVTVTNTGGINGVNIDFGNDSYGATPGLPGLNVFNLSIPVASVLFRKNIDSVKIKDSSLTCSSFNFNGLAFTNFNPVNNWQWFFGDGNSANSQNTSHTYTTPGNYTVKLIVSDINGCKDSISKVVTVVNALNFDFSYQQNSCNPLSIQFAGLGTDSQNPYWSFGDATSVNGITNPFHIYPSLGNYIVKYSVGNGACTDTVTKTISLSLTNANLILTNDTTICKGSTKQLMTTPSLGFCWTPSTYLSDPNSPNPVSSTPQNITYYFTAQVSGNNIISNGNFSSGNTGFTSQYNYANPNTTEGQYFIGSSPQTWNNALGNCVDHTGGNGNMMLVNGSPVPNVIVWSQTVNVIPNTNYAFSTWIQALYPPNPAQLSFSINGRDIGSPITASLPTCNWSQFYTSWNSGNNTSAVISIVNKNTLVQGNDFALDDISFAPVSLKRDSVKIIVEDPVVTATNSTGICEGTSIQLNALGATSYSWSPSTGLNNSIISNPVATPAVSTQYIVTGLTANGCAAKDTVDISILSKPAITKSADASICAGASTQLAAGGGTSYNWSPALTLDNPSIPNPTATPTSTTTYYVTVTGLNTCKNTDSIKITVKNSSTFAINPPLDVCPKKSVQLNATGGHLYSWTPTITLDNPAISNPNASPAATTTYTVQITDTVCHITGNLSTSVTLLPLPVIKAIKSNDIDCSVTQSILAGFGGTRYSWTPANTLNNPNSSGPTARPTITTTYVVAGTNPAGCTNYDSVTVNVTKTNKGGYLMPTGFTPNNDGLNDCYGIKYWGMVEEVEFSIYNRWGERVFYTKNPVECWDGKYKNVLQDPAVFIYVIKAKTSCESSIFRKGTFALIR